VALVLGKTIDPEMVIAYVGAGVAVAVGVALTVLLTTTTTTSFVGSAVGTAVETTVGISVAVGVATGAAGWDVHPASRIPINRIARTTNNFFMHVFWLFRYLRIFNYFGYFPIIHEGPMLSEIIHMIKKRPKWGRYR
jgi:hypothetical protein